MRRHPVVEQLWAEVESTLEGLGYRLVQMLFGGPPRRQALTLYVDGPASITADDCARVAEVLSVLLDSLDPIGSAYSLVVSSPGWDRPLGRDEDFAEFAGRLAVVRYVRPDGKARRICGRLVGVENDEVHLETEGGRLRLPLAQVTAANLQSDTGRAEAEAELTTSWE